MIQLALQVRRWPMVCDEYGVENGPTALCDKGESSGLAL